MTRILPYFSFLQADKASCSAANSADECLATAASNTDTTTTWSWMLTTLLLLYVVSELLFYLYFYLHLVPHANQRRTPDVYHDYPKASDRVRLCRRILNRLEQKAARRSQQQGLMADEDATECFHTVIQEYLLQWFDYKPERRAQRAAEVMEHCGPEMVFVTTSEGGGGVPGKLSRSNSLGSHGSNSSGPPPLRALLSTTSTVSSSNSSYNNNEDGNSSVESNDEDAASTYTISMAPWTIPGLTKQAVADFFSWAFFAKDTAELTAEEQAGLDECFVFIEECTGIALADSGTSLYEPRRLSLETVQAMHRPWLVYAMVAAAQVVTRNVVLPAFGFQRVRADSVNLTAWYRPAAKAEHQNDVCLFFHGIAPSGLGCYLPMIQSLLGKRQQSLIMFENPSVQCQYHALPQFHALTEEDTVLGVQEVLTQLDLASREHSLTLCGHSFGSCPITWILRRRNQFQAKFQEVVLLDPVTLLLSEPTVMARFLYDREDSDKAHIRFVVASELFTETYLRRHFCWYNSELSLEDFCGEDKDERNNDPHRWTIVLSGKDEIVPSPVVQEHVAALQTNAGLDNCNLVYWPHARHANCVMSPFRWNVMKSFLFLQEQVKTKVD